MVQILQGYFQTTVHIWKRLLNKPSGRAGKFKARFRRKFICHKLFHCNFLWECPVNTGFEKTNTAKSPVYYLLAHSYVHVEAITFIFWCFPCIPLPTRSFLLFITSAFFIYVSIHFQWYWQGEFFFIIKSFFDRDHFISYRDVNVWFRGGLVKRN